MFLELDSLCKKKAQKIYINRYQTGGGPPLTTVLTDLEERLLSILGEICIQGIHVVELGLVQNLQVSLINHYKLLKIVLNCSNYFICIQFLVFLFTLQDFV